MSQSLDKIEIYNDQTKRSSTYDLQDANAQQKIKQLQEQFEQPVQEQVNNWLNEHPEVTTTVQNGSLEEVKFTNGLKLKTIKDYVTPEMFGAKGDGVADDTDAVQKAIISGEHVLMVNTYLITSPIVISNREQFTLNATSSIIVYTGELYAFKIIHVYNSFLNFGKVKSENGGCIHIFSDSNTNWSQYINISFNSFLAKTNCIFGEQIDGWINEIRISDGRLTKGLNGISLKQTLKNRMTQWHFSEIGFEGVTNGVSFNSTESMLGYIFVGCRYAESFNKLLVGNTPVNGIIFVGSNLLHSYDINLPNSNGRLISPIATSTEKLISNEAILINGNIVINNPTQTLNIKVGESVDLSLYEEPILRILCNNASITKIILPIWYGCSGGINEFYFSISADTRSTPFIIEQDGLVIKTITSDSDIRYKTIRATYFGKWGFEIVNEL